MRVALWVSVLVVAAGCGDDEVATTAPEASHAGFDAARERPVVQRFEPDGDERAALAELGAVPPWQAVIDRGAYLARRDRGGAVFGRLTAPLEGTRWLLDETEGGGALAVRVHLPEGPAFETGERLLVHGAWRVDEQQRWYWDAARVQRLSAAAEPMPAFEPGLMIAAGPAPGDAVPVSEVAGAGPILFEVVRPPLRPGDGWLIADDSGADEPEAMLLLPGEREPYGAQDLMSPDERWQLERGQRYAVGIGRFRRREGRIPVLRALEAPIRVTPE